MMGIENAVFVTCLSGCVVAISLFVLLVALQASVRRLEGAEVAAILAFRVRMPLQDVVRHLSGIRQGPDLPTLGSPVLNGFRAGKDMALLLRPSVSEANEFGFVQTTGFDGAVVLWEEASGETLALFLAEPIFTVAIFRSMRLETLRRSARSLAGAIGRIAGVSFEELPAEEAGRLRARLLADPWGLGRRVRAVERILALQVFSVTPRLANRVVILSTASGLSAFLVLALFTSPQASGASAILPVLALFSATGGVMLFSLVATNRKAASLSVDELDPDAFREAPDLPGWAAAMVVASGPVSVVLEAAFTLAGAELVGGLLAFGAIVLLAMGVPFGAAFLAGGRREEAEGWG